MILDQETADPPVLVWEITRFRADSDLQPRDTLAACKFFEI